MSRPAPTPVLLISDATGAMGEHVLQAIFTQFPEGSFRLETLTFVNSEAALAQCVARLARTTTGLVFHATIYPAFKRRIERTCRQQGLAVYDLTGPIMRFAVRASGRQPTLNYSKLHELTPGYFDRVIAIEFAIEHDDGRGLNTMDEAQVILTGVSRTSKTPTSMFLALAGWKAANVPIVMGLEPPTALLAADPRRVICLTMHPESLTAVRAARTKEQLGHRSDYADLTVVRREVVWSRRLAEHRGWHLLDVTGRAVEETAARIMDRLRGTAAR